MYFRLPAVQAAPYSDDCRSVDRVRQLAGRRRRWVACSMEVDTPAHGDGRDDHLRFARRWHALRTFSPLRVEVLDHVGVREGVDLRRDREAESVPAGQVGCARFTSVK